MSFESTLATNHLPSGLIASPVALPTVNGRNCLPLGSSVRQMAEAVAAQSIAPSGEIARERMPSLGFLVGNRRGRFPSLHANSSAPPNHPAAASVARSAESASESSE